MSILDIKLPTELTLENINKTFMSMFEYISKSQQSQILTSNEMKKEIEKKPSLIDVMSTFAQNIPKTDNNILYLDIYSVHGILRSLTDNINVHLQTLADNFKKQEVFYEKLILKVNQSTRLLQKKNEKTEKKLENYLNFTQNYFSQDFFHTRLRTIFQG